MILSAAAGVVDDAPRKRLRAAAPLRAEATRGLAANAVLEDSAKRRPLSARVDAEVETARSLSPNL